MLEHDEDESFESLLTDFHEALARGEDEATFLESVPSVTPELRERLITASAFVRQLHSVWHRGDASSTPPEAGSNTFLPVFSTQSPPERGRIGRFEILRELGRGATGLVLLAIDPQMGRQVAIKVPLPDILADEERCRRFVEEAEVTARLSHPHLLAVYESANSGPICYMATEYCAGPNLARWLQLRRADHPPATHEIVTLIAQIADAVHHAHTRGVLHRDLKPSNVLLLPPDVMAGGNAENLPLSAYVPKVADFGLAKLMERGDDRTRTGVLLGTLHYMSPEQAAGKVREISVQSDIYAIGAMLYEMLTGQPPCCGETDHDTLLRILGTEPVDPRSLAPRVPRDLAAICLKCLEKRAAARYATAAELAADLRRHLQGLPTHARSAGSVERLVKWVRRRPVVATLSALCLGAVLAICAIVFKYDQRLGQEVVRANTLRVLAEKEAENSRRLLYSANVRLAHEAYLAHNITLAKELLDRDLPQPGQEDLREFAWHYLSQLCTPRTPHWTAHGQPVHSVVFSPDGTLLATGAEDGSARIWEADTGKELHILRDEAIEVPCVAFSPDGKTLASGHLTHGIRLWDVETGAAGQLFLGHTDHVMALAYSHAGQWLASGSRDGTIRVWDVATGSSLAVFDGFDVVRGVAFSADDQRLFAADEGGRLLSWKTTDWMKLKHDRCEDKYFALTVSPSNSQVLAAGQMRAIEVGYTVNENFHRQKLFDTNHSGWIQALAISPDGAVLASAGKDATIRLWSAQDQTALRTIVGHTSQVWSLAWSPDGTRLASAGDDGVRIWTLDQNNPAKYDTGAALRYAFFSADGSLLIAQEHDRSVTIRDGRDFGVRQRLDTGDVPIAKLKISADGSKIATVSKQFAIEIWRRANGKRISSRQTTSYYGVMSLSPTGDRLAYSPDGYALTLLTGNHQQVAETDRGSTSLRNLAFSPDSRYLISVGATIEIRDAQSMRLHCRIDKPGSRIAMSPNGRWLAVSADPTINLVDLDNGFSNTTLATTGTDAAELAFCGETLAVGITQPATISLWDVRTRQEMLQLSCDCADLVGMGATQDGRRLIAWGTDRAGQGALWEWKLDDGHATSQSQSHPDVALGLAPEIRPPKK
jgi:WD40 repeat protein